MSKLSFTGRIFSICAMFSSKFVPTCPVIFAFIEILSLPVPTTIFTILIHETAPYQGTFAISPSLCWIEFPVFFKLCVLRHLSGPFRAIWQIARPRRFAPVHFVVLPNPPFLTSVASSSTVIPYSTKMPWAKPSPASRVSVFPSWPSFVTLINMCPSLSE